ncbi:MAG: calcium-binding protein [Oscillatoriales cyanobacterium SM2_1_8]|nr:calcium-binding protein [Oscillatoriales cyanobacterium SM2_1_8]
MALILGTDGGDRLTVNTANNDVRGLGGNDVLSGAGGSANRLYGNQGNDTLLASAREGSDSLFGGQGDDVLIGHGSAQSRLQGEKGNDLLFAGLLGSELFGGEGNDTLFGGFGNDLLDGGVGINQITFAPAQTVVVNGEVISTRGYGGNDTIQGFQGGAQAEDVLRLSKLDDNTLIRLTTEGGNAVIRIQGTAESGTQLANQTLTVLGVTAAALLTTGRGALLVDFAFIDFTTPGLSPATDGTLSFRVGDIKNDSGLAGKTFVGGQGPNRFSVEAVPLELGVKPSNFADTVTGGPVGDTLVGFDGNDSINGGPGNDVLAGSRGQDTLAGGPGADTFVFADIRDALDTIIDFNGGEGDRIGPRANTITAEFGGVGFNGGLERGVPLRADGANVAAVNFITGSGAPSPLPAARPGPPGTPLPTTPLGGTFARDVGVFYYDSVGHGLYWDGDGISPNFGFVQFVQFTPAPVGGFSANFVSVI